MKRMKVRNREISVKIPTGLDYAGVFSVQPLALSGETMCWWLEWSTNFLAGRWCSTRSSLNFEICGAVPKYRFKIFWSVPTYRLDWVVLSYSRCRPLAPPMSADGCQWRPHPCYVPPLAQSTMSFGCSLGAEPQPCWVVLTVSHWHKTGVLVVERRSPHCRCPRCLRSLPLNPSNMPWTDPVPTPYIERSIADCDAQGSGRATV